MQTLLLVFSFFLFSFSTTGIARFAPCNLEVPHESDANGCVTEKAPLHDLSDRSVSVTRKHCVQPPLVEDFEVTDTQYKTPASSDQAKEVHTDTRERRICFHGNHLSPLLKFRREVRKGQGRNKITQTIFPHEADSNALAWSSRTFEVSEWKAPSDESQDSSPLAHQMKGTAENALRLIDRPNSEGNAEAERGRIVRLRDNNTQSVVSITWETTLRDKHKIATSGPRFSIDQWENALLNVNPSPSVNDWFHAHNVSITASTEGLSYMLHKSMTNGDHMIFDFAWGTFAPQGTFDQQDDLMNSSLPDIRTTLKGSEPRSLTTLDPAEWNVGSIHSDQNSQTTSPLTVWNNFVTREKILRDFHVGVTPQEAPFKMLTVDPLYGPRDILTTKTPVAPTDSEKTQALKAKADGPEAGDFLYRPLLSRGTTLSQTVF